MILLNRRKYFHRRRPQGAPADLADAVVTLASETVYYTGNPVYPSVFVTYEGATLVVNTDYTLNYSDNTEVGAATVVVTGMGEFAGQVTKTFYITAAPTGWAFNVENMAYVGRKQSVCYQGGRLLAVVEDYTNSDALIVCAAGQQGNFIFGQKITKDAHKEIHVENMASSAESGSNGSGEYIHASWISGDGKMSYWRSNNTNKTCILATSSVGYDFGNLTFDTSRTFDKTAFSSAYSMFVFSADGSRVFSGYNGDNGFYYNAVRFADVSTPFDLFTVDTSSASSVAITEIPMSYTMSIHSLAFSPNGRNVLISAGTSVYQFLLESAFDLSRRELVGSNSTGYDFHGLALVNNAKTLLGMTNSGYVYEYDLTPSS